MSPAKERTAVGPNGRAMLPDLGLRPLSARSLVLSTLLGTHPPTLSARDLVAMGKVFGVDEGTVRTALSRMVANGELEMLDSRYSLGPRLKERQASLTPLARLSGSEWDGSWWFAIVVASRRSLSERRLFRAHMRYHHMGELRPDVWIRPTNLDGPKAGDQLLLTRGPLTDRDARSLVRRLWDIDAIAAECRFLLPLVDVAEQWLASGDPAVLPDTFMIAVAVARFLLTDPLLPRELAGKDLQSDKLRLAYERLEQAHAELIALSISEAVD